MVASFRNFHGKIWVGFCLNIGKHFFLSFHFKANRNSMPSVWEIGMFLCDNQLKFQTFSILNFETNFLENKNLFQKTGVPFFFETTKIENTSFPFKTALSEANFKTNRMATTKWTFHKEWSFASNFFIFLENLFQF